MAQDSIITNLRKGKYIVAAADFLAAICFFVTYSLNRDNLFLVLSIALAVSGIAIVMLLGRFEKKVTAIINKKE